MEGLAQNAEFDDWESFLATKKLYEDASKTLLVTRGSTILKGENEIAVKFRYARKIYECKAGAQRNTHSQGHRSSSTYKMNCPALVKVEFNGTKLVVTESNLQHFNHSVDEQTYDHYPENMQLTPEQGKRVEKLISLGADKKLIKMDLMKERGGKPVLVKAIHNVQTKMQNRNRDPATNSLEQLYDALVAMPGAKVRFISNQNDEFVGVYFQDERMIQLYKKYPEVVLFDATYKLNNLNFGLFVQLCIDSNGETEIVSLYICRNESREGIGAMLVVFKEFNQDWDKTKIFLGDKDFADRSLYTEHFPNAVLQICLFHVLQIFNREITTTKRNITTAQRHQVLGILQRLCYAQSRHSYDEIYEELRSLNLEQVMNYFNENWDNIKDEWTVFTNNRTERINRTIKQLGNRNSNLLVFFENLTTTVAVLASEKDIKAVRSTMKVERKRFDDPALERYHNLLTPFIYKKVEHQYKLSLELPIQLTEICEGIFESASGYTVTEESCSCTFFSAMNVPCRHIFKLLTNKEMDLFLPTICLYRWSKQYYCQSHPALSSNNSGAVQPPQPISVQTIKVPDERNKYKKAAAVTKDINNLASTMAPAQYEFFLEQLVTLRNNMLHPDEEQEEIPPSERLNSSSVAESHNRSNVRPAEGTASSSNSVRTGPATNNSEPNPSNRLVSHNSSHNRTNDRAAGGTSTSSNNVGSRATTDNSEPVATNQLVSLNSRNDVGSIKLPEKITALGRPKGKMNTAIGLKKRKSQTGIDSGASPAKKKFLDLSLENQALTIVRWLTNKTADQILSKKISTHEIIEDGTILNRLRNDGIDFAATKKFFETKTYKYLRAEIDKLKDKSWSCVKCSRNLSGEQIMCHSCLDWYHVKCVGYDKAKGNSGFYCNDCTKMSYHIDL